MAHVRLAYCALDKGRIIVFGGSIQGGVISNGMHSSSIDEVVHLEYL